jgi:hypothetical protein
MDGEVRIVDRAGVGGVRCELEGDKARIGLKKNMNTRYVETGYGRLFFRYGGGLIHRFLAVDRSYGARQGEERQHLKDVGDEKDNGPDEDE